ncbi:hypothetical protein AB9F35_33385, partial [Rhizobium leguminosarum]
SISSGLSRHREISRATGALSTWAALSTSAVNTGIPASLSRGCHSWTVPAESGSKAGGSGAGGSRR